MNLWAVDGRRLAPVTRSRLDLERELESWLEADPSLLGLDFLIIGRQVRTAYGGLIDLLGLDREGNTVVIELKRDKTPRDIVAQCLDYASWVSELGYDEIEGIYSDKNRGGLSEEFEKYFGDALPETLNQSHQMLIVAATLDDATSRIIDYLSEKHTVSINAVFFNTFELNGQILLGRSFLADPEVIEERSFSKRRAPWTGFYFVNTGITDNNSRDWSLNQKYSFISAGGGPRWISAIKKLKSGDKIFAYIKGKGYVGYGTVADEAVPVTDYVVQGHRLVEDLPEDHPWPKQHVTDESGEWLVRVDWKATVPASDAKWLDNGFANQNVVCKLREPRTFEFLKREFSVKDE